MSRSFNLFSSARPMRCVALLGCAGLIATSLAVTPSAHAAGAIGLPEIDRDAVASVLSHSTLARTDRSITVSGTCSVEVDPDTADISMGIYVEAADAAQCQDEAADIVDAVAAALDEAGVAADQVATGNLDLYPTYDYSGDAPVVNGYRLDVSLDVTGVAVDRVGEIVSVATGAGANQVWGVSYYSGQFDDLYRQALLGALDAARFKADAIAAHEGVVIAGVSDVVEGYENRAYRSSNLSSFEAVAEEAAMDDAGGASKQIAIDPGTVEIQATVTATYAVFSEELLAGDSSEGGEGVEGWLVGR